jgi:hypothetical protein
MSSRTTRSRSNSRSQIEHIRDHHLEKSTFEKLLDRIWVKLPQTMRWNLTDTLLPENIQERGIDGEVVHLEIHLAWYRDILGHIVFHHFRILTVFTLFAVLFLAVYSFIFSAYSIWYALVPLGILVGLTLWGSYERFEYFQWRLLVTNARMIISIPQQNSWPLVDNIDLIGLPKVLDTNWSSNPVWRIFQFFTGARDLSISISALQFAEGTARVKDALVIPDIMPEDFHQLKALVFKPK